MEVKKLINMTIKDMEENKEEAEKATLEVDQEMRGMHQNLTMQVVKL